MLSEATNRIQVLIQNLVLNAYKFTSTTKTNVLCLDCQKLQLKMAE